MIEFRTNSAQSLLVFEQEIGTRSGLAEMPAAATLNTLFVFHFFRHLAPAAARLGMPAAATPNLDVCADSFLHPFIPVFRSVSAAPCFGEAGPQSSDAGSPNSGVKPPRVRSSTISPSIVFSVFGQRPENSLVSAKKREKDTIPSFHRASADWNCLVFFFSGSVGNE